MRNNRPIMKERHISNETLVRNIAEASQPAADDISAIVMKQQKLLISALQKKSKGLPLTDEEQAARLDHASQGVTGETRQAEALDVYKTQQQNQLKADRKMDKELLKIRQYE